MLFRNKYKYKSGQPKIKEMVRMAPSAKGLHPLCADLEKVKPIQQLVVLEYIRFIFLCSKRY